MTNPVRVAGKCGKRPPSNRDAIAFADIRTGIPVPPHPQTEDYLAALSNWQMLGNDRAGDCVAVTWANFRRLVTKFLATEVYPSQDQVWAIYRTQNPEFDPNGDPNVNGPGSPADGGMDIQTLLEYLVKVGGPDGVKAVAFAKVDFRDAGELDAALAIFGGVWTGVQVTDANQREFEAGQPWDDSGTVEGGHSVLSGGYTPDIRFITWAAETEFTPAFVEHLVDEAWVVVWPEHLGTAQFEAGIDRAALASAYQALTGKVLPLPPAPTPGPIPGPSDPDAAFAAILRPWVTERHVAGNHHVALAAEAWLAAKGL